VQFRYASKSGNMCVFPPTLACNRKTYGDYYDLLEHALVEGAEPPRGPNEYYPSGQSLKLRQTKAARRARGNRVN
jgi:hypothetical protein